MRIGINIGFFLLEDDDWRQLVKIMFEDLANKWPSNEFVFFAGKNLAQQLPTSSNINIIVLPDTPNNGLGLKIWYDYKLASQLKKLKIDILVNVESTASLRAKVPQILFVKDLAFLGPTSSVKNKSKFIKRRFQKSLDKAETIVSFDQSISEKIIVNYSISIEKIKLANFFANPKLQPTDWQQKELVKEKYSEGKEFFLCYLNDNSVDPLVLLKAFSLFKKRQQSNMQLLIVGDIGKHAKDINTKFATYKYRGEVKMLNELPLNEASDLLSAAYCLLHFSNLIIDMPLTNAMQIGVPNIILKKEATDEALAGVVLFADANSPNSIAEQMKIIYKDENLRSQMIAAGLKIAEDNSIENASTHVWSAIHQILKA